MSENESVTIDIEQTIADLVALAAWQYLEMQDTDKMSPLMLAAVHRLLDLHMKLVVPEPR